MFVSSTKPTADDDSVRKSGSNVLAKNRKRIGESGEPCGIPVVVLILSPRNEPSTTDVVLCFKNDAVKLVIHCGMPFILML